MKRIAALLAIAVVVMGQDRAVAQESPITPGALYLTPFGGPFLANQELLRNSAIYPTPRPSDPFNPVVTDIKLDPGIFFGLRTGYGLTRRLLVEAEFSVGISIAAIRQLEIKPDAEPGDEPQYETTTMDARIYQYGVGLSYHFGTWRRAAPYFTCGAQEHILDLRQKGEVDTDPVRDRAITVGLGVMLPANDRLGIRIELKDFMYNYRFDNQFIDPVMSRLLIFDRPDFYNTTSIAGTKFQHDILLSVGFMVELF